MLYETAASPPEPGSFQFLAFIVLYTMREERIYRASVLQASASLTAGSESEQAHTDLQKQLTGFMSASFPYIREKQRAEDTKMKKILDSMHGTAFKVAKVTPTRGTPKG